MCKLFKNFIIIEIIAALMSYPLHAEDLSTGLIMSKELTAGHNGFGNEFVSGDYPGAVLMKINLWGAVGKSGIHFIPTQTDLITLLSYAGGPTENAKLDEVFIKRWSGGKERLILVNLEELVSESGKPSPTLEANDVIVVPAKKPLISQDTVALVGVVSSLLSIIAVGVVLIKK